MKRNVVEMVLGAVVLLVAAYFLVFSYKAAGVQPPKAGYRVSAKFSDIGSLSQGSDVRMSGVKIGTISSISLDKTTYQADVTIHMDEAISLPEDSSAIITSEGLLGGNYIAIEPGGAEDVIPDGGHIQYTQSVQNLEKLLGKFIFSLSETKDADEPSL